MSARNWGNPPLCSTTAPTQSNPSTATLCAELIIPAQGDTSIFGNYEVRYFLGGSTGMLWRLECASGTGLSTTSVRKTENGASERVNVYTGSNLSAEFVVTWRACYGDRFRATQESTVTATAAAYIQAEIIT